MTKGVDFNLVSGHYEKNSLVQQGAAETLFSLLNIGENESVLDVGCGPGNLTKQIRKKTNGRIVGIDDSAEMIKSAKKNYSKYNIAFCKMKAEEMNFHDEFDVIFCNSTFQWFTEPSRAVKAFHSTLKKGGRVGIQAPGGGRYCENFLKGVERVRKDERTCEVFSNWENPFFMPENTRDYNAVFENVGFKVISSEIKTMKTRYTPEEAFDIFSSGAIAGYLNQEYYRSIIIEESQKNILNVLRSL
ncbi:MAG: class I SAM-dependent methyltransferase [Brevinematia bacterium]